MKKKLLILALVVVALAAVAVASSKRGGSKKGIPVTLGTVKTGPMIGKVSGPGKVNPEALVDISAHLPGKITRLAVREGDTVAKGQLLLELDRAQYEARLDEARANVESQKSQVELASAQRDKALLDLKRAEDLHTRGVSSDQEADLARTSARIEQARLASTQQQLRASAGASQGGPGRPRQVPVPLSDGRCRVALERRGRRDRDHRHDEQPRHGVVVDRRPVAHGSRSRRSTRPTSSTSGSARKRRSRSTPFRTPASPAWSPRSPTPR